MSINKHNSSEQLSRCESMSKIQAIISGKWKILILWYIYANKVQRFNELQRKLDRITQATLTKQLRELEEDSFIIRNVFAEVPPKVEYSLSSLGESFIPILLEMKRWSDEHLNNN